MPVHPVTGESLPNPGMGNVPGPDVLPMGGPNDFLGGPPFDPRITGATGQMVDTGGEQNRLSQLLEAREMIDQEIASIIGVPPGTENMDMLTPPSMDPRMALDPMMAQGGMPTGAVPGTVPGAVPGMALPGLLGGQYA